MQHKIKSDELSGEAVNSATAVEKYLLWSSTLLPSGNTLVLDSDFGPLVWAPHHGARVALGKLWGGGEIQPLPYETFNAKEAGDYSITADGIIEEQWNTIEYIPSRVLEIGQQQIVLECLTDPEKKTFENRAFDKMLLEGVVPFTDAYPVMVEIYKRKGEVKFKFIDGTNLIDPAIFEKTYFLGLPLEKLKKRPR